MGLFKRKDVYGDEISPASDFIKFLAIIGSVIIMSVIFWKVVTYAQEQDMIKQYGYYIEKEVN